MVTPGSPLPAAPRPAVGPALSGFRAPHPHRFSFPEVRLLCVCSQGASELLSQLGAESREREEFSVDFMRFHSSSSHLDIPVLISAQLAGLFVFSWR